MSLDQSSHAVCARASACGSDITPEMEQLLRAGAGDKLGLCCSPGQVEKNWKHLKAAKELGYIRFPDITSPCITHEGRQAIGAPSEREVSMAAFRALLPKRTQLIPTKDNDPRTDFDYRSYRAMGWVCIQAVRQPDYREGALTVRVGRTIRSEPQFLGPRNSIILPESDGRFVLAIVPAWLMRIAQLSTYPMPIAEDDPDFSDDDRTLWDRLRSVTYSVNSRIRNAGRGVKPTRGMFGETA